MNRWMTVRGETTSRVALATVLLVVTLGLLAACGGDDSIESQPTSEATTIPSTAASATPTPVPPSTIEAAAPPPAAATTPDPAVDPEQQSGGTSPRGQRQDSDSTAAPASGDIRDVDFENFTYTIGFDEDQLVTTTDGLFEQSDGYLWFSVLNVMYGNLDDDDADEAVVTTGYHTGGSGRFGNLNVYDIDGDRLVLRDALGTGDRAHGGLEHAEIIDGQLLVESFDGTQGACCPNRLLQQKFSLGASGLIPTESLPVVTWLRADMAVDSAELVFQPGTSSGLVATYDDDPVATIGFEALAGQWLSIDPHRGPVPVSIQLIDALTGSVVAEADAASFSVQLPSSGDFEVRFVFGERHWSDGPVVQVSITSERQPALPTWSAELREIVVTEDPLVVLSAAWPRFDTSDFGQLNFEIQQWLAAETDWWVAGALEYPTIDDAQGGTYELSYTVSMVSDDLVSIEYRFYEYLCCRPYPNYGQKSLIVDLAERRILGIEDVLDLDRLTEIHDVWIEVVSRDPELIGDPGFWLSGERPGFDSLILVPGGVEFGTDRRGAMIPTSTFVSWDELGDLARPDIVARSANGVVPAGFSPG